MVGAVFAPAGAQVGWLVLAVVLHVCGPVSRGVAWRGVLAASWPEVTRRRVCAWYVCGAGLSGLLSARGGDAIRVTLAKRELPGATWPALAGTLCAEASFESASRRRDDDGRGRVRSASGVSTPRRRPLIAAAALAAPGRGAARALDRGVCGASRAEVGRAPPACCGRPGHCPRQVLP